MQKNQKLCDLQVNGYIGVDYSSSQLTEESFAKSALQLLKAGTYAFLPTIITSPENIYKRNLEIMSKTIDSLGLQENVPGFHIEGPFISMKPGAVGAHNPDWVQKPSIELLKKMQEWANGKIKILTIAADAENSEEITKFATKNGITVSLGHQLATVDDMKRLAQAGATLLTHLGNGLPNLVHRHNNQLLAGLAVDELTAMIITDGHHLPDHVIKAIIRAKDPDKVIITSDASPLAGMPAGNYQILGNNAVLEESGLLHNPEKECLVGSSATIKECYEHLALLNLLSQEEMKAVIYDNPMKAINLD